MKKLGFPLGAMVIASGIQHAIIVLKEEQLINELIKNLVYFAYLGN